MPSPGRHGIVALCLLACLPLPARAQSDLRLPLERPGEREFVLDTADLITDADERKIRGVADKLLTDKAAPIIVVTIDSMANQGGAGLRIETYARMLFDQWGIGPEKIGDSPWNYGLLLLVSRDDRKARIELGAGWRHDQDVAAQHIMDSLIIPRFRQGDFSGGIVAGVDALDKLARNLRLPSKPVPASSFWIGAAGIALAVFTVISLGRRGSNGWAWLFWGVVFSIVGTLLYHLLTSRLGSSGRGYSGGSFGGGFSGGGGATGSW